jgi:hypothetical protein
MGEDFKRLETEFLALARRIYDAGVKAERDRIIAALHIPSAASEATSRPARERSTAGYGAVSAPVLEALNELSIESPEGVGAKEIAEHFERRGSGPDYQQVRAGLKTLTLTGNVVRAARGKYLPRAAIRSPHEEENLGDESPGSIDRFESMAAE